MRAICSLPLARALVALAAWLVVAPANAAEVSVAVASNFSAPMRLIAQRFEQDTGHKAVLSIGATGQFHAQIRNGAPFAVLLAADDETPERLEHEGLTVPGTRFTYAIGRLVLWSKKPGAVDAQGQVMQDIAKNQRADRIAIANPRLAPYGRAAIETLERLGLRDRLAPRLVEGANITQAFQFVASGNAAFGFVALSQVIDGGQIRDGSGWIVPASMHAPIRQDAVLLKPGQGNPAAQALLQYLRSEPARAVIRQFGYER